MPILGICYGMQALLWRLGAQVAPAEAGEFGHTSIAYADHPLFMGMEGLPEPGGPSASGNASLAVSALVALGYSASEAAADQNEEAEMKQTA